MLSFGILASGSLGMESLGYIYPKRRVNFVLTDRNSEAIIHFCNRHDIPCFAGNPNTGEALDFVRPHTTDVLLSVNYLFILGKDIIDHAQRYAVNFHGSLLPKYRGRTPHVWAIINNEQETGITAHLMSEGCDEGDIIYQERIRIAAEDTGGSLLDIFKSRYSSIIDVVVDLVESENIVLRKQDKDKATYFGKRVPEDGLIDWNWQKERIRNWVRAQARPYPGAFTFCDHQKITVHRIEFSDHGFDYNHPNGMVLYSDQHPVIKTPNGAVMLTEFEATPGLKFKKGAVLHG